MSRIGKLPIALPSNVEAIVSTSEVVIKGPLGFMSKPLTHLVKITLKENNILCFETTNNSRQARAMFGTMRALVNNMVIGVIKGFEKRLVLVGIGFRAQIQAFELNLSLGFSHPIIFSIPKNIQCELPTQTEIVVRGIDNQVVGQVAAKIRSYRPPEPYKGKGIRYSDEIITLKDTKKK